MDLKKRKDFTRKKEGNFLISLLFFFVSLIMQGKIKFYNAAVQCFLNLLENLQGNFCDEDRF